MIEKLNIKGELAVVLGENVGIFSLKGWELVAIISETGVSYVSEEAPYHNPGACSSTMNVRKAIPFTMTSYLMRRDEESVTAKLSKKIEFLEEELSKQSRELVDSRQNIDSKNSNIENLTKELIQKEKFYNAQTEQLRDLRDSCQKMEDDLAKVRKALGTQRMYEILAVKE